MSKENRSLILIVILVAFSSILLMNTDVEQMVNNGDYWRVTRSIGLVIEGWTIPEQCISWESFQSNKFRKPSTTMAGLILVVGFAHKLFQTDCFFTNSLFWVLSAIYWLGVFLIVLYVTRWRGVSVLIVSSAMYFIFSYYFKSYYEEASVLALSPLMLYSYLRLQAGKCFLFLAIACLIIFSKSQMILLTPIIIFLFIFGGPGFGRLHYIMASSLVLVAAAITFSNASKTSIPNKYNRIFNGLGWSLQHVENWSANNFNARHHYFYTNQERLQKITEAQEPILDLMLLGTSFWPTGSELFEKSTTKDSTLADQKKEAISRQLSWQLYFDTIPKNPRTLVAVLASVYRVFLTSDYSMDYIRWKPQSSYSITSLERIRHVMHRNLGAILMVVSLALFFLDSHKKIIPMVVAGFYLSAPLFVFVGDGFYEFEKHIIPYVMLLGFFILLPILHIQALVQPRR